MTSAVEPYDVTINLAKQDTYSKHIIRYMPRVRIPSFAPTANVDQLDRSISLKCLELKIKEIEVKECQLIKDI